MLQVELQQSLHSFVTSQLQDRSITLPPPQEGEFDWVVCQSGALHWEMKLVQSVIDVMWPFVYEAFSKSQGYTTPCQLTWAKSCKNHHWAFDELSRFTDGVFDEVLRPYVLQADSPSPEGFLVWCEQFKSNLTYSWLVHLAVQYCFPVFMFHKGMRHNDMPLFLEARRLLSPVVHARNHPGYQVIEMFEEYDRLSWPAELRQLLDSSALISR